MHHASNYKSKIVVTALNTASDQWISGHGSTTFKSSMWTICGFILHNVPNLSYCVALAYSSDEKRAEWESFWKLLASSISSNKSHWWCIYRLLFESSRRKMIHCTKLFKTTLKSYILFEILSRMRRCSYVIYTTALFIKGASTKSLHHA